MTYLPAGLDPGASRRAKFPLPDRNSGLYGLDSGAAGRKGLGAVRGGRRNRNSDFADPEGSNSMAENDLGLGVRQSELLGNAGHLAFGHGAVGLVLEAVHTAAVVVVPHDAHEQGQSSVAIPPDGVEKGPGVDGGVREEKHRNMIRPSAERERQSQR